MNTVITITQMYHITTKIFLTKKRNTQRTKPFIITKINKHKQTLHKLPPPEMMTTNDNSFETISESSDHSSLTISFHQIKFPDFFNDKPHTLNVQETLKQYKKVCDSFNDNEEVELYLVRKESVLSNKNK